MSFAHGHVSFNNNVKVYLERESHFANQALVQANDARDLASYLANLRFHSPVRGNVTKLKERRFQLLLSVVENYQRRTESRPPIGRFPTRPSKYRD